VNEIEFVANKSGVKVGVKIIGDNQGVFIDLNTLVKITSSIVENKIDAEYFEVCNNIIILGLDDTECLAIHDGNETVFLTLQEVDKLINLI